MVASIPKGLYNMKNRYVIITIFLKNNLFIFKIGLTSYQHKLYFYPNSYTYKAFHQLFLS